MPDYADVLSTKRFPRDINTSPVSVMYLFDQVSAFQPLSGVAMPDGSVALNTNLVGGLLQVENLQVTSTPATIKVAKSIAATTDTYSVANTLLADTSLVLNKTLYVKNTGANDADVKVVGSVDGVVYDILIINTTTVKAGEVLLHYSDKYMVGMSVSTKSTLAGSATSLKVKYAGIAQ